MPGNTAVIAPENITQYWCYIPVQEVPLGWPCQTGISELPGTTASLCSEVRGLLRGGLGGAAPCMHWKADLGHVEILAHISAAQSTSHVCPFAYALCYLRTPGCPGLSLLLISFQLKAARSSATTKRQSGDAFDHFPLFIFHIFCPNGRETQVLQRTVLAGVTKIGAFLNYK